MDQEITHLHFKRFKFSNFQIGRQTARFFSVKKTAQTIKYIMYMRYFEKKEIKCTTVVVYNCVQL